MSKDSNDREFEVGMLLQIHTYAQDSLEEKDTVLTTRIAEIFGRELAIEIPIEKDTGRMIHLLKGDEITATFFGENGVVYSFPSKVKRRAMDKIPLFIIERPLERAITRIQRRSYLRIPAAIEFEIILQNPVKMARLNTLDLSGGGLTFRSTEALPLDNGQLIAGVLHLPDENRGVKDIHFSAVIVRRIEANEQRRFPLYAIQFLEINERDRDQIIRYCIRRQLELHKK